MTPTDSPGSDSSITEEQKERSKMPMTNDMDAEHNNSSVYDENDLGNGVI